MQPKEFISLKTVSICIALVTAVFSDYIALNNGMTAKTDILDTVGCKIQIRRNGNIIQIAKEDISFVVCKAETLFYKNFICTPEIASKKSNRVYEDSFNSEKVKAIIEKMNLKDGKIRESVVYYCKQPITGDDFQCCWDEKFLLFEKELQAKFKTIQAISHEELYKMLKSGSDTNTILLPFRVKFAYSNSTDFKGEISQKDLLLAGGRKSTTYGLSARFVKVIFNLIVIDLKENIVLYNEISDFTEDVSANIDFSKDEKDKYQDAKRIALENVLLNSLNSKRKKFTKLFK